MKSKIKYAGLPKFIANCACKCNEMMFYQYLPIKLHGGHRYSYEERLSCFEPIIREITQDYINYFGYDKFLNSYVYLTVKHLFQSEGCSYNRFGYHSDGFMTKDINYIWSDSNPTIFNKGPFFLTKDDKISLIEMQEQALAENDITFPDNSIVRLNQFHIHKVNESGKSGMRTFLKMSFSEDKYNLIGNSRNYLLKYDWEMLERGIERNIPQASANVQN
ncbi:hypothetical protein SAMN04515674_105277 [Pseudarcicella hirudinis]|uniref:2OG-Fe(II) oxygenase superfamily protein n=1 Tax=Pseudarcicella hirudinis TaxID=1079859 RepID=A0A1I5SYJ7_9BACT|nr:hypothetical protein [Pseudarcicella hirudinis]SFP75788.1 hypothetical protein SAMN04515674_105277 [Pseudarcicella hirudinis]